MVSEIITNLTANITGIMNDSIIQNPEFNYIVRTTQENICPYNFYLNYHMIFLINMIFLFFLEYRINDWIRSKIDLNKEDWFHRRTDYLLSDKFFYGSLFTMNLFATLFYFLWVPFLSSF